MRLCVAVDIAEEQACRKEVEGPCPPRVIPRLSDHDGECGFGSCLLQVHGPDVEDIFSRIEIGVDGFALVAARVPVGIYAFETVLIYL